MAIDLNSSCEDAGVESSRKENEVLNIDSGSEVDGVLDVPEYADEIYDYLKKSEVFEKSLSSVGHVELITV